MTALTIELPDPKFQKNDVVKWEQLILHVRRVHSHGEWTFYNGEHHLEWDADFKYDVTVQGGEGLANNPIRPGMVLTFSEIHISEPRFDTSEDDYCEICELGLPQVNRDFSTAEKIDWEKPIIGPDTLDNINERQDDWNGVTV